MKKLAMMSVLTVMASAAFAQRQERPQLAPEERAQKVTEHLKKELNLSEEQYQQVLTLNETRAEKMAEHREVMQAEREKIRAEQKEFKAELDAILTAEQKATLEAKNQERKAKMQERMKHRRHQFKERKKE